MPLSLTIVPNPDFKPENQTETENYAKAKAKGALTMFSIVAREVLSHPRTMYIQKPVGADKTVKHEFDVDLHGMTNLQLVQYSASLGRTVKKGMKKSDLIDLIEKWQDDIATGVLEDDEE